MNASLMPERVICTVLDDYQDVAFSCADWSALAGRVELRRIATHLGDEDAVARALGDSTIVVAMRERTPFPATLLNRLPGLRLLVTTGMRNRSIDMAAARALGITVCGTPGERGAMAELAWAGLLALMRDLPRETANFRAGGPWQVGLGRSLEGRRLGIVGLGKQGARMARFGQAFGMDVCGWTRTDPAARAQELGITALGLDALFRTSDVVTLQLSLVAETRGFVTAQLLGLMRPDAVLVNTARGALLDEAALIRLLEDGRIAGAVLDVFEQEPLPGDHPFRRMANVLATPHVGYVTQENYRAYYGGAVEGILGWLDGAPCRILNQDPGQPRTQDR